MTSLKPSWGFEGRSQRAEVGRQSVRLNSAKDLEVYKKAEIRRQRSGVSKNRPALRDGRGVNKRLPVRSLGECARV
jgi:hypothetical protein